MKSGGNFVTYNSPAKTDKESEHRKSTCKSYLNECLYRYTVFTDRKWNEKSCNAKFERCIEAAELPMNDVKKNTPTNTKSGY